MNNDRRLAKAGRMFRLALAGLFDQSRPFGRLALVHAIQAGGSSLITISLAGSLFFSISPHAAEGRVLLYLLLTIAPFALVGPALSPLLDRSRQARRSSLAVANAGAAFVCLAMARDIHDLWLFPEAFAVLVLNKLYGVAKAALVPQITGRDEDLAVVNARLAVLASMAGFAIMPIGIGVLKIGAVWVLRLAAVVFVAGTVASLRLPRPVTERQGPDEQRTPATPKERRPRLHEVAEARRRLGLPLYPGEILAAVGALSVARAAVGFSAFFLAFELRRAHAATWWFGVLIVGSGAGSLLGSVLVPRLRRTLNERQIIAAALGAMAVGGTGAALIGGLWAQVLLTFVVGIGPMSAKPALDSIVQRSMPPVLLGRAFGRIETRLQLVWVLAAIVGVVIPFPFRIGDVVVAALCTFGAVTYGLGQSLRRHERAISRNDPLAIAPPKHEMS